MMINTDKTFCTYENIYYEMWETVLLRNDKKIRVHWQKS